MSEPAEPESPASAPAVALPEPGSRWMVWLCAILATAIPLAAFSRLLGAELLEWDDFYHLRENPYFRPLTWNHWFNLWTEPHLGEYIPVAYSWFALGIVVSGLAGATGEPPLNGAVFHAGNLLLHAGCCLLVFRLLYRIVGYAPAACVGALAFGLHPLGVEMVAWVSAACRLLSALFGLLAIWHYLEFAGPLPLRNAAGEPAAPLPPWRRFSHYGLALVFFALALMSKPSAVAVLPIAAVLDWGYLRRPWHRVAGGLACWAVLAAAAVLVTKLEQSDEGIREVTALAQRPLVAADSLAFYLYKLAVPWPLMPDYGRTPSVVFAQGWARWTWLVPAGALFALCLARRREAWIAAGVFVAGLLPVLGLLPFAYQDISTVADRYAYLPMLGPALACAHLAARWRHAVVYAVAAAVLAGWSVLDWRQQGHWHDNETFFRYSVAQNPRSVPMLINLVAVLSSSSDHQAEALSFAERALQVSPEPHKLQLHIARASLAAGQVDQAIGILREAVQMAPQLAPLRQALAEALQLKERNDEALAQYDAILRIEPANVRARIELARLALARGDRAVADKRYAEALASAPQGAALSVLLADLALALGDAPSALRLYRSALAGSAGHGAMRSLFAGGSATDQGLPATSTADLWVKIGQAHESLGEEASALEAYRRGLELGSHRAHGHLGQMLGQRGDRAAALRHYRQALDADPNDRLALAGLAWMLATSDPTTSDTTGALRYAMRLCALESPPRPRSLDVLAAAYASQGRFREAAATARRAVNAARDAGQPELADEIGGRIKLYEDNQPYRLPP